MLKCLGTGWQVSASPLVEAYGPAWSRDSLEHRSTEANTVVGESCTEQPLW